MKKVIKLGLLGKLLAKYYKRKKPLKLIIEYVKKR